MLSTLVLLLFVLTLLILILCGGLFFYVYWFLIQKPVPQLDGRRQLRCLDAPVKILRDRHAIPHIYAHSEADLFRAQGYIHAQERLWQMEQSRRVAYGTLSELFGAAALEADRFSRIIGFRRAAEAEIATVDAQSAQILQWYAEGVNAYMESHAGQLAAEFNLLRKAPAPWTPIDTIAISKVTAWGLSINWESELLRLRLLDQLGPHRAAELEPNQAPDTPVTIEGVGSHEVQRLVDAAGLLLNQYEQIKPWLGIVAEGQGSNSWVVAPKRSLTRRPMLCNDPHLALQMPGIWFENHLHAPGFEVSGATMPGAPGVLIGHNESIAWGMTNGMPDTQDLFLERPHPHHPDHFAFGDAWEEAEVLEEIIHIRRSTRPHRERVVITRHGPLINALIADEQETPPLALCWSGHRPGTMLRATLKLNRAANWDEFNSALAEWCEPAQNVTFADVHGNIGYTLAGRIPQRESYLGLLPAPGWLPDAEWKDFIPHHELPHLFNPESGLIVTANNKMAGDDYGHFIGIEFFPGWRARRIEDLLQRKERLTLRDMEQIQLDYGSAYAEALAPWIAQLNSDDPWENNALQTVQSWNYRMDVDSKAALVFQCTLIKLLELVYGDKLGSAYDGYTGNAGSPLFPLNGFLLRAQSHLLQLIDGSPESVWYTDAATGRKRSRDQLLQEALTQAVRAIRHQVGDSNRRWDWGRSHQIRYVHSMGSVWLLRNFFNRGPFPIGGDGTTPNQTRHAPTLPLKLVQVTASYRQIFEVGVWDRAQSVTTSGQSGHPLSPHYDDQITLFREGIYHDMPWTRGAVEEAAVYRMTLAPEDP